MSTTRIPDAVHWYEGMRLAPHHFWQQDMRAEQLAARMRLAAHPYPWGVFELNAAVDGTKALVYAIRAIMPDGQYVELLEDEQPLTLALPQARPGHENDDVPVYLVCPRQPRSLLDRRPESKPLALRVPNRSPGGAEMPMQVVRPQLELAHQVPAERAEAELLPLLRARRQGSVFKDAGYTPPSLLVQPGSPLHMDLRRLVGTLRSTYGKLKDFCDAAPHDMTLRPWMLMPLGMHLLELEAVDAGTRTHPFELYVQLCRLLGALGATLPPSRDTEAPRFDFLELGACLATLAERIENCLLLTAPDTREVPFKPQDEGSWQVPLASIPGAQQYYVGLERPEQATHDDMRRWIEDASIAPSDQVAALTRLRLPGLGHTALTPEQARTLGARPALSVFRLDGLQVPPAGFAADDSLRLIRRPAPEDRVAPVRIVLLAKKPAAKGDA